MKKILVVVGTRPNFIKVTRFREVAKKYSHFNLKIVHTGQHYDDKMAAVFFHQFGMQPDINLNIGQGSPVEQIAAIMKGLEKVIRDEKPDLIMVPGDVNSTLAAALAANKSGVKLAHIESGLRSFDRSMPEEFNRIVTDELSDILFVTEQSGIDNLEKENKKKEQIFFVGNTMIDTMVAFEKKISDSEVEKVLGIGNKKYILVTMHRPSNVDTKEGLGKMADLLSHISVSHQVVFPIHPRTRNKMKEFGLEKEFIVNEKIRLTEPLDYFSFQKLIRNSQFVITDSGGIQEETTFLRIPCITLRPNTERPVTVTTGTNVLLSFDNERIKNKISEIENGNFKRGKIPEYWDGKATERIFEKLAGLL
ncbi:MAG: UDP-N-acetylglucosamine 2-epimerase (non-hydrolyzing) [Bacteroidetes bacterium]|nr:UDP-N-acetylglucosamine 2-epimerase (non-hydrolyzing) [Bacteroidota bacterium]